MASLIEECRRYAADHRRNTQEGDSIAANAAHDQLVEGASRVIKSGQGGLLLSLFDDNDPWVQLWAATHALEVDEPSAIAKLEGLERAGIPLVSMSACYTVQSWRNGELKSLRG